MEDENGKPVGPRVHPFMKDWEGNYYELDVKQKKITILEGAISNMSKATQNYIGSNPKADQITMVYGTEFFKAIQNYKLERVGDPYHMIKASLRPFEDNCIGFKDYVLGHSRVE